MRKDQITRELTMEVIVGAFMIMVMLGMGYFTIILSREPLFTKKITMEVVFNGINGLNKGDRVVIRGMHIGKVKGFKLEEQGVRVTAILDEPITLRSDYKISVVASSILGGRQLEIDEGSPGAKVLPADMPLRGRDPHDLLAEATELITEIKKAFVEGHVISNIQEAVAQVKQVTTRVSEGKGMLGKLLSEDETLYKDLSATVASLKTVTARLEKGEGTLGKLMSTDDQVYKDLAASVASLKNITASLEKGEGALGKLMKDNKLYTDVESIVSEARATLDDFRETAPIVTFTSVFFGAF